MNPTLTLICGVTLLTVVGIAFGGTFLLRVLSGAQGANDLQKSFFRAGHAHAGVLVTLGLVTALLTTMVDGHVAWSIAGSVAILVAAILIPAGFFLSVLGADPRRPNRLIVLLWSGAASLVAGLAISGVVVIAAGAAAM